jgi:hypothetical protein
MSIDSIVKEVSMEEVVISTVEAADDVTSLIVVDMNMYARPAREIVIIKMRIIAMTSETPRIKKIGKSLNK